MKASPGGHCATFIGFDGNNETTHYGIAGHLIDDLKRFSRFSGRSLNSHCLLLDVYRRMLTVYDPIRRNFVMRKMRKEEVLAVTAAAVHPDHR
ncbi:YfbU family protein [Pseudomonas oryzihabitans]|uniref:YfbU family protein n=1 Tax=Pseudomonas oryzihabitans TaxID=47885 RepID=UPI003917250B